ncbi:aminopeptidase P N-terminal domain-containing protein [Thiomicrorhabdus xiamenensis]|uniref:Xaa-Pro aminopeptidase n=1 Tax=Thiomicrorhabdus xiamenensis TaxID=2739063 RepID=A0A7D4NYX5_9GAMM|nr:aminopeptidase P N-terminal domain-containing protein [Thiomicrorhabdus xiamenensis]QKI89438.1 aminopeptidase P N-terminal domain-containing protein [Thiomicrorhabdus xiamenensis]
MHEPLHGPLENRQRLFAQLPDNSAALVFSGEEQIRNRDVEFPFRTHSDFWYLTGFAEPDAVLLLLKNNGKEETAVFLRPKDLEQEIWQGRRLGVDAAAEKLGLDQAFEIESLLEHLPELVGGVETILVSFADFAHWTEVLTPLLASLKAQVRKGIASPAAIADLDQLLHEQRLIKSESEIAVMRQAAQISVKGHLAAMRAAALYTTEAAVQADLEAEFIRQGAQRVSFNTISASAENACILHYTENSDQLNREALLLVDAGAEYQGYAGDITHTFPPGGKFSQEQAALYRLVLKAQRSVIAAVKPGVTYDELHQITLRVLTEGLVELQILHGDVNDLVKSEAYKDFFMHGTGHWLGLDVHDVGRYKIDGEWRPLLPGMVLTVEPGLYISSRHTHVDAKWHNIGIRIEDDVLVTDAGHEVLTTGLPRTVEEIEAWFAENA